MLSNQSDPELFSALRSGNTLALGILYERYGGVVYGLALRMLNNSQEAEDLTQEIFITLSRSSVYDPKRGTMLAFLMTITRNKAIDLKQKTKEACDYAHVEKRRVIRISWTTLNPSRRF